RAFFDKHERLYGFATDEPWELVAIRQRASIARASDAPRPASAGSARAMPTKTSPCVFDAAGAVATPRYARAELDAGQRLPGPAIVEDAWSTVIVPPGAALVTDAFGHLHIETGGRS
ncbi:MAG: hydantoinase/oxoprolinase family protein, partial [Burkholderiales bacterium]|nr:hydantoinase/oxoprolinase family protein [Burkholderiales bacterium]